MLLWCYLGFDGAAPGAMVAMVLSRFYGCYGSVSGAMVAILLPMFLGGYGAMKVSSDDVDLCVWCH